jgi:hypothetical protein
MWYHADGSVWLAFAVTLAQEVAPSMQWSKPPTNPKFILNVMFLLPPIDLACTVARPKSISLGGNGKAERSAEDLYPAACPLLRLLVPPPRATVHALIRARQHMEKPARSTAYCSSSTLIESPTIFLWFSSIITFVHVLPECMTEFLRPFPQSHNEKDQPRSSKKKEISLGNGINGRGKATCPMIRPWIVGVPYIHSAAIDPISSRAQLRASKIYVSSCPQSLSVLVGWVTSPRYGNDGLLLAHVVDYLTLYVGRRGSCAVAAARRAWTEHAMEGGVREWMFNFFENNSIFSFILANAIQIKLAVLSQLLSRSIIVMNKKYCNRLSSKIMHTQINIFNM